MKINIRESAIKDLRQIKGMVIFSFWTIKRTFPFICRVIRGGSWEDSASYATDAFRNYNYPDLQFYFVGFQVVRP